MNRFQGNQMIIRRLAVIIMILLSFPVVLVAQQQVIEDYFIGVTIGVRADQGEPGMHATVTDVNIEHEGYYQVYPKILYNSGDDQLNETFYMTLEHSDGSPSIPEDANAGPYKVVLDDPGPPHTAWRDAGLYFFKAGVNTLKLHHYAAISNQYPQFLNGPIIHTESVKIVDSLRLISKPFIDASVSVHSTPPRVINIEGDDYGVAYSNEHIRYDIIVKNDYVNTIRHAVLTNVPPDLLINNTYSTPPAREEGTRDYWELPDLAPGDSFLVTLDADVPTQVPEGLTALIDSAWVLSINDIDSTNNISLDTVYTASEIIGADSVADVGVDLVSETDSVSIVKGKTRHYAQPGEAVSYRIQLDNTGPDSANDVVLNHILPGDFIYLSATQAPDAVSGDTLRWTLPLMLPQSSQTILINGFVSNTISVNDSVMISEATTTAANDTLLINNSDMDSIFIYLPYSYHNSDLEVALNAQTDTTIVHENRIVKAAVEGTQYDYRLTVRNNGPQTSYQFWLQQILPDSVTLLNSSRSPTQINSDTLMWQVDSLSVSDLLQITLRVNVKDTFPDYPFELASTALVNSPTDTLVENNEARESVYAIPAVPAEPTGNTDVGVDLYSLTDTTVTILDDIFNAVRPGEAFQYIIRVEDLGPERSDTIQVVQRYPEFIEFLDASMTPKMVSSQDIIWEIPYLDSGEEINMVVDARLQDDIPLNIRSRTSQVMISADNDTNMTNNVDSDSIRVLRSYPEGNYDVGLDYRIVTDNRTVFQGDTLPAVFPDEKVVLRIGLTNYGPEDAYNLNLFDHLPDSIEVNRLSLQPEEMGEDNIFWVLDTLKVNQTGYIDIESVVASGFPYLPYELTSLSYIESTVDTVEENNQASLRFVVIAQPAGGDSLDVGITVESVTDTTIQYLGKGWNAIRPNEQFTYEITVSNFGPYPANNLLIEQTIPDVVTYQTTTLFPETVTAEALFWTIEQLDAGVDTSWVVFAKAKSGITRLQPAVSPVEVQVDRDSLLLNNTDADTTIIFPGDLGKRNYDLQLFKTAVTDTHIVVFGDTLPAVFTNESIRYQLVIENKGPGDAYNIKVQDVLPDSLILAGASITPLRQSQDTLFWHFDSLKAFESISIEVNTVSQPAYGYYPYELINVSTLSASRDTTSNNNLDRASVFVLSDDLRPGPDFDRTTDVTKTADWDDIDENGLITVGDKIEYTISIVNSGNAPASNVIFSDSIPDHTVLTGAITVTKGEILGTSPIQIDLGTLQPRESVTIHFTVNVISNALSIINQGDIDSPDIEDKEPTDDPTTPDEDDPTIVEPKPSFNGRSDLLKRAEWRDLDGNAELTVGDIIDYTVVITNSGHSPASDVIFFDRLDQDVILYGDILTTKGKVVTQSPIQIEIGFINPGETVTINFSVQLTSDLSLVSNQGELRSPDTDENEPTDDPSTPEDDDPTITEPEPNFSGIPDVIKSDLWHDNDGNGQVSSGDIIDYTVSIYNSGGRAATDVVFTDILPANTQQTGTVTTSKGEVVSTSPIQVNIGTVQPGEKVTIRFSLKVNADMDKVVNQGQLDSPDIDKNEPTDDPSTPEDNDPTITEPEPNFDGSTDVIKSDIWHDNDGDSRISSGDIVDYTITIYNSGGRAATDVVFTDPLPANTVLSGTITTSKGEVVSTSPIRIEIGTISARDTVVISFSVKVTATVTQVINQGQIDSPDLSNPEPTNDPDTPVDDDPTVTEPTANFSGYADVTKSDEWHDLDNDGRLSTGDMIDYTVTIRNSGGRQAENVLFMDPIPVNTTLQGTVKTSKGSVTNTSPIQVRIGTVGAKESVTIQFTLRIDGPVAQIINQGTVSSSSTPVEESTDDPDTPNTDDPTVTEPDPAFDGDNDLLKEGTWNDLDGDDKLSGGDVIDYTVTITNSGMGGADSVVFTDPLPANTSVSGSITTSQGEVVSTSPIRIELGTIGPSQSVVIQFSLSLDAGMDLISNQGYVISMELSQSLPTDDPNTPDIDDPTVIIGRAADFSPSIEALPAVIDVTDSIQVRVQVPVAVSAWDLWIYLPNGNINKSFADNEVSSTTLTPNIWYQIDELYRPQKMITNARQEELIFEVRATDSWGRVATAQTRVVVKSSNYLVLDRNVFRAEYEDPLQIHFKLSYRRTARLDIYDSSGRHIVELTEDIYDGGWNTYLWNGLLQDGQKVGSGVYLVTLRSGEFNSWKKFIIVR